MRSHIYNELRAERQGRIYDKWSLRVAVLFGVLAVVGFGLCIYYQVPIVDAY